MRGLTAELFVDKRIDNAGDATSNYILGNVRMSRRGFGKYVGVTALGLGLAYLSSKIPKVYAPQTDLVAGTTTSIPDIDGVWQQGEWDDAFDYKLPIVSKNKTNKGEIYTRFKHDDSKLYSIIDSVSDVQQNGRGFIIISFDANNNGWGNDDVAFITDRVGTYEVAKRGFKIVSKYGTSPHSNILHRIWEYSASMDWITRNAPKNGNNQPVIGYDVTVRDSDENVLSLNPLPLEKQTKLTQLTFGDVPVQEGIELFLLLSITPQALAVGVLTLPLVLVSWRRNRMDKLRKRALR